MKNILVPTAPHDVMPSVFRTALLAARHFDSYIEGFALRPALAEYIPFDMVGGLTWVRDDAADEETVQRARELFETAMREAGIPQDAGAPGGSGSPSSWGWFDKAPAGDDFLGSYGRVFDMTVVGRPHKDHVQPSMGSLEMALFETGHPILIAPPTPPETLGETAVIAWNCSTETARAVVFAKPFLRRAKKVYVMTTETGTVPGPSGEELARALRRSGIEADARTVPLGRRTAGEAAVAAAADVGCDLLIKGAYTQSRLRQMIFGGITSHILAEATMPVLMSH